MDHPEKCCVPSSNCSEETVIEHFSEEEMKLGHRLGTELGIRFGKKFGSRDAIEVKELVKESENDDDLNIDFNLENNYVCDVININEYDSKLGNINEQQSDFINSYNHKKEDVNIPKNQIELVYNNECMILNEQLTEKQNELQNDVTNTNNDELLSKINYGFINDDDNERTNEHTNNGSQYCHNCYTNHEFTSPNNLTTTNKLANAFNSFNSDLKDESEAQKRNSSEEDDEEPQIKDSGYAWVVVGAMFVSNILTTGYVKGFGVIYNEILEQYPEASGTMAGVMMSLLSGCRSLFAPLVGTLASYIGIRKTMCFGATLYTSALFASYFSTSLLHLSITLGAAIGLSHCIIESCQVVVISQYFEKKLSKANGIRVAGSPCGGILYPLLLTLCLEHFGLKPTFLVLAGITLIIFICAFLMKPCHFSRNFFTKSVLQKDSDIKKTVLFKCKGFSNRNSIRANQLEITNINEVKNISYRPNDSPKIVSENPNDYCLKNKETIFNFNNLQQNNDNTKKDTENIPTLILSCEQIQCSYLNGKPISQNTLKEKLNKQELKTKIPKTNKDQKDKPKKKLDYSFLKNPQYLLFVFMAAGIPMGLPLVLYYTTIYAKSVAGLSPYEVTILLSYQAVLDVCLRIFIGWVNNKNLYKKSNGFVVCLWLSALGSVFMTFGNNSLLHLIGSISLYTFGPASFHTFVNVILTETFGKENIASTWGFVRMTQGAFSFLHPTIIGYLVDQTGAYTIPFLVMGGGMFLCGVVIFSGRFFRDSTQKPVSEEENGKKDSL